ncbi:MAG: hypothetical protein ACI9FN_003803 [Saprospiraceae bacterium]|jgi:hypothetical protein
MPLPVPDGEGAIGFRDGRFDQVTGNASNSNPNWKEYAGACLTGPLLWIKRKVRYGPLFIEPF